MKKITVVVSVFLLFSCGDSKKIESKDIDCVDINECFIKDLENSYDNIANRNDCDECSGEKFYMRYYVDVKSFKHNNRYYFIGKFIGDRGVGDFIYSTDCNCENPEYIGATGSYGYYTKKDVDSILNITSDVNQIDLSTSFKKVITNKFRIKPNQQLLDSLIQINDLSTQNEVNIEVLNWETQTNIKPYISKIVLISDYYFGMENYVYFYDGIEYGEFRFIGDERSMRDDEIDIEEAKSLTLETVTSSLDTYIPKDPNTGEQIPVRLKVIYDPRDNTLIKYEKVSHKPYGINIPIDNSMDPLETLINLKYESIESKYETLIDNEKVYGFLMKNKTGPYGSIMFMRTPSKPNMFMRPSIPNKPFFRYDHQYDLLSKLWNDFPDSKKVSIPSTYFKKIEDNKSNDSSESYSQNGTYSYSSGDVQLSISISGDSWIGKTKICEYCEVESDSGIVNGTDLYDSSGSVKIGYISGNTISTSIASSMVTLRK